MITIIGAGHAGCYAGNLLAKKGYKVNIWEKNPVIGKPMQCTGIVTRDIDDLIKLPKKIIHTTIHHARIHAPNKKYIKVKLKNGNYILKRTKFVQYMAELAESQGVKILTKKKYPSNSPLRSNQIIDASGPLARPSHHINKRKRIYLEAPQILAEYDNDNIIDMYTNIGTFAWVTPVTKNTALIGLLAYKNSLKLMKKYLERLNVKKSHILERNGGLVPVFDPWIKTQLKNHYLLGDAATQVKATTAGGIIQGMIAAEALTDSITNKKNYDIEWRKKLFFDLFLHLKAHRMMEKMKERDWNKLVQLFSQEKLKSVLETHNREKISKFLFQLPFKEPKLLSFLKFLL